MSQSLGSFLNQPPMDTVGGQRRSTRINQANAGVQYFPAGPSTALETTATPDKEAIQAQVTQMGTEGQTESDETTQSGHTIPNPFDRTDRPTGTETIGLRHLAGRAKEHHEEGVPVGTFSGDNTDPALCRVVYLTFAKNGSAKLHLN